MSNIHFFTHSSEIYLALKIRKCMKTRKTDAPATTQICDFLWSPDCIYLELHLRAQRRSVYSCGSQSSLIGSWEASKDAGWNEHQHNTNAVCALSGYRTPPLTCIHSQQPLTQKRLIPNKRLYKPDLWFPPLISKLGLLSCHQQDSSTQTKQSCSQAKSLFLPLTFLLLAHWCSSTLASSSGKLERLCSPSLSEQTRTNDELLHKE